MTEQKTRKNLNQKFANLKTDEQNSSGAIRVQQNDSSLNEQLLADQKNQLEYFKAEVYQLQLKIENQTEQIEELTG